LLHPHDAQGSGEATSQSNLVHPSCRAETIAKLEWELSISHTQKDQLAPSDDKDPMAWEPHAILLEEVILEEAIHLPLENFPFMGLLSPITLLGNEIQADTGINNMASPMEDFLIFYIEEEISYEYLQMANNDLLSMELSPLTVSGHTSRSIGMGAEGDDGERRMTTGHLEDVMDGT
jgi:hypothetical protein